VIASSDKIRSRVDRSSYIVNYRQSYLAERDVSSQSPIFLGTWRSSVLASFSSARSDGSSLFSGIVNAPTTSLICEPVKIKFDLCSRVIIKVAGHCVIESSSLCTNSRLRCYSSLGLYLDGFIRKVRSVVSDWPRHSSHTDVFSGFSISWIQILWMSRMLWRGLLTINDAGGRHHLQRGYKSNCLFHLKIDQKEIHPERDSWGRFS